MSKRYAYAVVYNAIRNGAAKNHIIMFHVDKQIETGDELLAMFDQVSRAAVSNGHADSLSCVSAVSFSLMNPFDETANKRLVNQPQEDNSCAGDIIDGND